MADFKQNYFQRKNKDRGPRSNNRILSPEVQVISSDGENLGILNTNDAINKAKNEGLDLIEIAPNANPPVCKIMDMGKFKYDAQKKANQAKKKQKIISLKEIKMLKPGQGNEIHITDAIKNLIYKNENFYGNIFKGKYLDCGTLSGYINSGIQIFKGK